MEDVELTPLDVLSEFRTRGLPMGLFYSFCEDAGFMIGEEGGEETVLKSAMEEWLNG
jgi:hypothetical protein